MPPPAGGWSGAPPPAPAGGGWDGAAQPGGGWDGAAPPAPAGGYWNGPMPPQQNNEPPPLPNGSGLSDYDRSRLGVTNVQSWDSFGGGGPRYHYGILAEGYAPTGSAAAAGVARRPVTIATPDGREVTDLRQFTPAAASPHTCPPTAAAAAAPPAEGGAPAGGAAAAASADPPRAAAPVELVEDERSAKEKDRWAELTPAEWAAAKTLGYDAKLWNMGEVPEQCTRVWSKLSQAEVGAAIVLGYTRDEWDAEATEGGGGGGAGGGVPGTPSPLRSRFSRMVLDAAATPPPAVSAERLDVAAAARKAEVRRVVAAAIGAVVARRGGGKAATAAAGDGAPASALAMAAAKMDERSAKEKDRWADLTPAEQAAATTLGYDATLWNMGDVPEQCTRVWSALSPSEVGAAIVLGYTAAEWDAEATGTEAPAQAAPAQAAPSGAASAAAARAAAALAAHRSPEGAAGAAAVARAVAWAASERAAPDDGNGTAGGAGAGEGADDDAAAGRSRLRLFEREAREGSPSPPLGVPSADAAAAAIPSGPGPAAAAPAPAPPAAPAAVAAADGAAPSGGGGGPPKRVVKVFKKTTTTRLGITLTTGAVTKAHGSTTHAPPRIKALAEGCPAADAEGGALAVGMLLIAVNGEKVHGHDEGSALLKAASGTIELEVVEEAASVPDNFGDWQAWLLSAAAAAEAEAVNAGRPPPPLATIVSLEKAETTTRLGITLASGSNNDKPPRIKALAAGCPAAECGELSVGMLLTAVNGERVRGHEQGTVLLKAATGTLLLEVRPEPKPPP